MAYQQQPPPGYPQQQMQPQMQYGGPPMGMPPAQPKTPAEMTLTIVFIAFGVAALGLLLRYITGFLDMSPGIAKLRNAGSMLVGFGSLGTSLSLMWGAFKVFEQPAAKVMAILGSIFLLIFSVFVQSA